MNRGKRLLGWMVWTICLLQAFGVMAAQEGTIQTKPFSYAVTPVPSFVTPYKTPWPTSSGNGEPGLRMLLVDRQISLLENQPRQFLRLVTQPTDPQAVQMAAQLFVYFNPEFQTFELHGVRVIRNGRVMDRTGEVKFELLQRETNLEKQLYDGEVSAVAILSDIRVNDIIEFERSVVGDNPIFQGRFSLMTAINNLVPIDNYRMILIHPQGRPVNLRAAPLVRETVSTEEGKVIHTFQASKLKAIIDDPDRPRWFDPLAWIEVSEFQDWRDVGQWANGLFKQDGKLAPDLRQQIETWRNMRLPKDQLVVQVLRWVQREVRYFGIEIGVNSHLPSHPNSTYERRYGDCKDKSLLLSTLLNELGISAHPALVSMDRNKGVARLLPAPHAFDHAIVRIDIDGHAYWLDATHPPQDGELKDLAFFDFGKALVIGNNDKDLETVGYPPGYTTQIEVTERYKITDYKKPAELVAELVLTRGAADRYRMLLTSLPRDEFNRIVHSDYLRMLPNAETLGDPEVRDDTLRNRLTLVRRYRIPELFEYAQGKFQFGTHSPIALDILRAPQVPRRTTPYDLPYPLEVRISQVVALPENPVRDFPPPSSEKTPYFAMKSAFKSDSRELRRDLELIVLKDHVPPESMPAFVEEIQRHRQKLGLSMTLRVAPMSEADKQSLQKELHQLDRYGNSRSGALRAQLEAVVAIRQNTLDIESGKLIPRQLARAFANRALAHDDMEHFLDAIKDIDKAIELDSDQVEYTITKARILSINGRFEESLGLFKKLDGEGHTHRLQYSDLSARGRALYYLGQYQEAATFFNQAAEAANGEGKLYQLYWQYLAAQRSGGAAQSKLAQAMVDEGIREWPYPVGEMLQGRITPEALLQAARNDDKGIERDQLAEAYFYLGQRALLDGNNTKAGDHFEECLDLSITPFLEHHMARIELKKLGDRPKGFLKWIKSL